MRNDDSHMRTEFNKKATTGEIQLELNDHGMAPPELKRKKKGAITGNKAQVPGDGSRHFSLLVCSHCRRGGQDWAPSRRGAHRERGSSDFCPITQSKFFINVSN